MLFPEPMCLTSPDESTLGSHQLRSKLRPSPECIGQCSEFHSSAPDLCSDHIFLDLEAVLVPGCCESPMQLYLTSVFAEGVSRTCSLLPLVVHRRELWSKDHLAPRGVDRGHLKYITPCSVRPCQ